MAQAKAARRGNDERSRAANTARLVASGKLEEVTAKRLARLLRNNPDKARGRV